MKKLIILILLTTASYSQNVYVSAGIDVRNAFVGSKPTQNKPALDYLVRFGMIGKRTEVNVGYERLSSISFDRFFFGAGHHFPLYGYIFGKEIKTELIPMIEPTLINRWGNSWGMKSSHLTVGVSLSLRYALNNKISLELQTSALPRTDLLSRYPEIHSSVPIVFSNYFSVLYRL